MFLDINLIQDVERRIVFCFYLNNPLDFFINHLFETLHR